MEPILISVVSALVAGATAKAKDVASQAVADAYDGLKNLIVRKLGKGGAVQSVEDDPESEPARSTLVEALAKKETDLQTDSQLKELVDRLERELAGAKAAGIQGTADIDIDIVRGHVNATVENLVAAGRIKLVSVVAAEGDATVKGLTAGFKAPDPKN
jgi:hypothetical protein